MIATKSVALYFNASNIASAQISVNGSVKEVHVKQLTIVNTNASTPTTTIGALKCDLITADQTLCNIPLTTNTSWNSGLKNKFKLSNSVVNSNYNFTLVASEQNPIVGVANLQVYVNLILEFY